MGFIKLLDSMIFGVIAILAYGTWLLIFGGIALVIGILCWQAIKVVLIGTGLILVVIFILALCGVDLRCNSREQPTDRGSS